MRPPIPPADLPAGLAPAGLWVRTVAWLVDALIVGLPVLWLAHLLGGARWAALAQAWQALGRLTGEAMLQAIESGQAPLAMLLGLAAPLRPALAAVIHALHQALWPPLLLFVLAAALYWPLLESAALRATLGKRLLGVQVGDAAGGRLGLAQAGKRHLAGIASWATLNFGHAMAALPGHRALHDRLADTRVFWHRDAARKVPFWGGLLIAVAMLLPLVFAWLAASSLSRAMEAAIGV